MLELFRKLKRSIVGLLIIGFVVVLMVGFGVDFNEKAPSQEAAVTIDGHEIPLRQYSNAYERATLLLKARYGDAFEQVRQFFSF